jgi:hypothetical protein
MSESFDVKTMYVRLSTLNNNSYLLAKAPSDSYGGGITVLGAYADIAGTASLTLVTFSNAGTPAVNGTISSAVNGTFTAGVPQTFTLSNNGWVDGGFWLGIKENNVGTATTANVTIHYVMGRG